MRILVTGCAGFIGSHVCERLVEQGIEVVGIDSFDPFYSREIKKRNIQQLAEHPLFQLKQFSISDYSGFNTITEQPIDAIIHLAAKAGVRPSIENPQAYVDTNITGTLNICQFALSAGIKKIVFASSSSVYGNAAVAPFKEATATDAPISPYAFTKKSGELILYNFFHLYRVSSICLRFFTVYGPRQRPDLAINKFVSSILSGRQIDVYGSGNMARDYTFIDDIVDGILGSLNFVLKNELMYEIINLGNNNPFTILELIQNIEAILGKKADLNFIMEQPGDVQITCADISKANELLQYQPKTKLKDGLKLFYDWKLKEQNAHEQAYR